MELVLSTHKKQLYADTQKHYSKRKEKSIRKDYLQPEFQSNYNLATHLYPFPCQQVSFWHKPPWAKTTALKHLALKAKALAPLTRTMSFTTNKLQNNVAFLCNRMFLCLTTTPFTYYHYHFYSRYLPLSLSPVLLSHILLHMLLINFNRVQACLMTLMVFLRGFPSQENQNGSYYCQQ